MTTALVVGATGLIGQHLVRRLAGHPGYGQVATLSRRPLPPPLDTLDVEQRVAPFDSLDRHADAVTGEHIFCALGTTRRVAGSKEAFRAVDLDYPRRIARLARSSGARHFSMVSAIGADADSRVFYTRTKGEAEAAVRSAGYPSGALFRPSVLGGRAGGRPLERAAAAVLRWAPARWRTVDPEDVALAMIAVARAEPAGWRVVESAEIPQIARSGVGNHRTDGGDSPSFRQDREFSD